MKPIKIRKITYLPPIEQVCDISVKDNHNLFVSHSLNGNMVLAHNCQSAEYALDENRKFRNVKLVGAVTGKDVLSAYSLAQLALEYGCSKYLETNMGKDDRDNTFAQPLEDLAEYGGVDAVIPFQMRLFQLQEIASRGKIYHNLPTFITTQLSHMIIGLVEMESNGLPVDKFYLSREVASGGAFIEARDKERAELYAMDAVIEANAILVKKYHGGDLFDRSANDTWVFDIDKQEHQQLLFFDVLALEPVGTGKNGLPSINKAFKDKYAPKDDSGNLLDDIAIPEVAGFTLYAELKHLYSAFLKGFFEKLSTDPDMRATGRLISNFIFLIIVTGRLGARKPSLQQVPSRSKLAKPIKRQFITPPNHLYVKGDFSSHEVRNGAIAANDTGLIDVYREALTKRKQFRLIQEMSDAELKEWADVFKALDLHRRNCCLWYGITSPLEVPKDLRQKSKTTTFGTIYGMHAYRLAATLGISEEEAEELIARLFETYPGLAEYIELTHEMGHKYLVVKSGIGRLRHLWGYLHTNFGVHGAMDRRSVNSRIQGVSSDEGLEGNYQLQRLRWELFHSQNINLDVHVCNMVHDSVEAMTRIAHTAIATYLIEHSFTTCVHNSYRDNYGMEFQVALEMDIDVGPSLSETKGWNYRPENLIEIVEKSVKWQKDVLHYDTSKEELNKFHHNLWIMDELRCNELRNLPKSTVSREMYLTKKIVREELWV